MKALASQAQGERPPAPDEEADLLRLARAGDPDARERLFRAHVAIVVRLAEARLGQGLALGDLLQEGALGLMAAITAGAFAAGGLAAEVEGAVGRQLDLAIEQEAGAERDRRQLLEDVEAYQRAEIEIGRARGREATEAELAEKLEWSTARTRRLGEMVRDARRRHDEDILAYIEPDPAEDEEPA